MSSTFKIIDFSEVSNNLMTSQFNQEIEDLVKAGVKIVLLDFKKVEFMTSSGLMMLVAALRIVQSAGGKLCLCSINEQVKMLFELTGVDQFFETFANPEEFNPALFLNA